MRYWSKYTIALLLLASCGRPASPATRDVVMVVNLVDDSLKVQQYLAYHQKVWPEVEAGFRKAGYKDIRLYRYNRTIVMIVTVPVNADLGEMGRVAESYDPKCKEWNQMMAGYQTGVAGTAPGQTWARADLFYRFGADTAR